MMRPDAKRMIHEIESAKPKYLISVTVDTSWLHSPRSETESLNGLSGTSPTICSSRFRQHDSPDRVEYYFDDIPQQVPELGEFILIYRRNP